MPAMQKKKALPVGVDLFEKIKERDYYYIDKTLLIKRILSEAGDVNLFTRPRRFGKTLNMSMLKSFFEIGTDPAMFDGLAISREREICEAYQGKYPVVFLSLKGIGGLNYQSAIEMLAILIAAECGRLSFLQKSTEVKASDKELLDKMEFRKCSEKELQSSLALLMRMLHAHYGKKVILLIDEYDVPLDKANDNGYYPEMVDFLRGFFGDAFKTNQDLCFAVVTGCLRISKESIFTGINNLKIDTIADERFDEFFGFTDAEVRQMLADYNVSDAYESTKEWYDGYRFGKAEVYCPWDVINHCDRLKDNPEAEPDLYWDNSSSNRLVRRLIDVSDAAEQRDIERLIAGEALTKKLMMNLTYDELDKKELLWSVLYQTGYLTLDRGQTPRPWGEVRLVIPNREIRELFVEKVQDWFADQLARSRDDFSVLYLAMQAGDTAGIEDFLNRQLRETISYYDCYEGFYHGFLLGLLKGRKDWVIVSNREAGGGRSDILIKGWDGETGIIIEVKRAKSRQSLEAVSEAALEQIVANGYAEALYDEGYTEVKVYGISFYKKMCRVLGAVLTEKQAP